MSEKSVPKMHSRRLRPVFEFVVIVLFYCLSGGVLDIAAAADTSQGSPEQINIGNFWFGEFQGGQSIGFRIESVCL